VIALDPGVRTFMTGYDPSGKVLEFGARDMGRINRLNYWIDDLQSRIDTEKSARKRYRMRRAKNRMHTRIKNLVEEVHKKLTLTLVQNYRTILLPKFESQKMVAKNGPKPRCIRRRTAHEMMTWSHYKFQQRLINKTREYRQCQVIIVDESYTSKTCGACGCIHQKLGGNKIFQCPNPSCGIRFDRDANGARNILLKFLTDYQPLQ
jgi:putative transposase